MNRQGPAASGQRHDRGGVQGTGHRDQADEVNGLLPITETTVDGYGIGHEATRYVQNSDGRFPPSPVDIDARWRISRRGKRLGVASSPGCGFIAWVWLHRTGCGFIAWVWLHRLGVASSPGCGFIVSRGSIYRGITHASEGDGKPSRICRVARWLVEPMSLAADTADGTGKLRPLPEERGIAACIPPSAEEPIRLRFGDHARWVYPRVGGQTKWSP